MNGTEQHDDDAMTYPAPTLTELVAAALAATKRAEAAGQADGALFVRVKLARALWTLEEAAALLGQEAQQ